MDIDAQIRKLARSQYWQNLYRQSKEIGSLQLFENHSVFSGLQVLFLFWCSVYETLYVELSQKEWKYLSEDVINDDVRCDAFLYWRSCQKEEQLLKNKQEQKSQQFNFKKPGKVSTFDINFEEGGS